MPAARFTSHVAQPTSFSQAGNHQRNRSDSSSSTCTLGRDDDDDDELEELFTDEVIDLTKDDTARRDYRNGETPLASLRTSAGIITEGDIVEIGERQLGNYRIDFLEVKVIAWSQGHDETLIRGIPFARTRNILGKLPKKLNELCMILQIHISEHSQDQGGLPLLIEIRPSAVLRKRTLFLTNAIYPVFSSETLPFRHISGDQRTTMMQKHGNLVCRWKMKVYFRVRGNKTKPVEEAIERIQFDEVVERKYRVADEILCNQWRGGRVKGGSWTPGNAEDMSICLDEAIQDLTPQARRYTLFDTFSGAGGVSRGARSAGFQVAFAVDKASTVWDTYKTNFPDTKLYEMSVDEFILHTQGTHMRTDILHLSPPCQYFSPAHTIESAHDDENIFALFGCNELIRKTRPRIITLEQTFGITHDRHLPYLRALIGDLTQHGYSVRWGVIRLCTWGSAQDRKRLIMLAAAPGEKLPPFPRATHSDGSDGLRPFTTIARALSRIQPGDDLHDLDNVNYFERRRPAIDANQLAMTITTGGGISYYPDGTRDFTLREFASLQGFPKHHRFHGTRTSIKRQIGNAFPPNTVKVLYKHLKEWLLQQDGTALWEPAWEDVVMIDDERPRPTPTHLSEEMDLTENDPPLVANDYPGVMYEMVDMVDLT